MHECNGVLTILASNTYSLESYLRNGACLMLPWVQKHLLPQYLKKWHGTLLCLRGQVCHMLRGDVELLWPHQLHRMSEMVQEFILAIYVTQL